MENRREIIREYIIKHDTATVNELCALFPDKSSMTVRRDLAALQDEGIVIRTYGGARINPAYARSEARYIVRQEEDAAAKEIITEKALELMYDLKSVYLDAGTTVCALAKHFNGLTEPTVITNSVSIACELLTQARPPQVNVIGGVASPKNLAATGSVSLAQLSQLNIDTAVMGTSGYTPESGFTNGNASECEMKREVIKRAHRVIMLMSSSKLGRSMLYTFAKPENIDILITDKALPPEVEEIFTKAGVKII